MPPLTQQEIDDALDFDTDDTGYDEDDDGPWVGASSGYGGVALFAVLDNKLVREADAQEWAKFFTAGNRRVAHANIAGVVVSTVFLGVNCGVTRPLWFETLVFGGDLDGHCERYGTWPEAVSGHKLIVQTIKDAQRDAPKIGAHTRIERTRRNNVVR